MRTARQKPPATEAPAGRLIGYARVSTEEQNLDLQTDALARAGVLSDDIHVEKVSSAKAKRPRLDYVLTDVLRPGDTLVVWKLDRLARSAIDLHRRVERITAVGASFKSLTQPFDTSTSVGRLMMGILAVMAEFERDLIRERTVAGMARARAAGKQVGAVPKLTRQQVVEIKRRVKEGATYKDLAPEYRVAANTVRNFVLGVSKPIK